MRGRQPRVHRAREKPKLIQQRAKTVQPKPFQQQDSSHGSQLPAAASRSRPPQAAARPRRPRVTETIPTTRWPPQPASYPQHPAKAGRRRLPPGQEGGASSKQFQQQASHPRQPAAQSSPPKQATAGCRPTKEAASHRIRSNNTLALPARQSPAAAHPSRPP